MRTIKLAVVAIALVLTSWSTQAFAQRYDRDFQLSIFRSAPGKGSFLTLEGANVSEHLGYSVGGNLSYGYHLLGVYSQLQDKTYSVVEHYGTLELMASFSIYEMLEFGLNLPIIYYLAGEDALHSPGNVVQEKPEAKGGLADPSLHLKLDLLNGVAGHTSDNFGLAFLLVMTFPVGNAIVEYSFIGSSSIAITPKLAFEANVWRLRFGVNLGYRWQASRENYPADLGQRLTYGLAIEGKITDDFLAMIELYGESAFDGDAASHPLEMYGVLSYQVIDGLWVTAAVGGGLPVGTGDSGAVGVGAPAVRGLLGLKWAPAADPKPDEEPEVADQDGDGIPDDSDRCIDEAEDIDEFQDEDGCPDLDNDEDGIPDETDQCKTEAEDIDQFEDEDGCPDPDNDKDGIPDGVDQCPLEKEIFNGNKDEDGCPDRGRELMVVTEDSIQLKEQIRYRRGSARIQGRGSYRILVGVLAVMKTNPGYKLSIVGYTDNRGRPGRNQRLSQARADTVRAYLLRKGIEEGRVEAIGKGVEDPIADNNTRAGRNANRRVEFRITKGGVAVEQPEEPLESVPLEPLVPEGQDEEQPPEPPALPDLPEP